LFKNWENLEETYPEWITHHFVKNNALIQIMKNNTENKKDEKNKEIACIQL